MAARDRDRARKPKKRLVAEAHLSIVPEGTPGSPAERGFAECPCTEDCVLHGECLLCVAYHGRKNRLPRCQR